MEVDYTYTHVQEQAWWRKVITWSMSDDVILYCRQLAARHCRIHYQSAFAATGIAPDILHCDIWAILTSIITLIWSWTNATVSLWGWRGGGVCKPRSFLVPEMHNGVLSAPVQPVVLFWNYFLSEIRKNSRQLSWLAGMPSHTAITFVLCKGKQCRYLTCDCWMFPGCVVFLPYRISLSLGYVIGALSMYLHDWVNTSLLCEMQNQMFCRAVANKSGNGCAGDPSGAQRWLRRTLLMGSFRPFLNRW